MIGDRNGATAHESIMDLASRLRYRVQMTTDGQRPYHNCIKIHSSLRTTPAMAAGVTTRLWDVSDLVALLVESEKKAT
jgi:hypothetical protein